MKLILSALVAFNSGLAVYYFLAGGNIEAAVNAGAAIFNYLINFSEVKS